MSTIERYIAAAEAHGKASEPDHEVGDLQDLVRQLWDLLPSEQRIAFLASSQARELLEWET